MMSISLWARDGLLNWYFVVLLFLCMADHYVSIEICWVFSSQVQKL